MTTIVGLEHRGKVYLGGDSLISFGKGRVEVSRDAKVWTKGGVCFGGAGDVRGLQMAQYLLKVPKLPRSKKTDALYLWLAKDLANALRECWSADGNYRPIKEANGTDLLVGVRGCLVYVDWDLSFTRPADGLAAIGTGAATALTSLRSTTHLKQPNVRLAKALDQAAKSTNATRLPFRYVSA